MKKTTALTFCHSLTIVQDTFILNLIKIDRIAKRLKLKRTSIHLFTYFVSYFGAVKNIGRFTRTGLFYSKFPENISTRFTVTSLDRHTN